MDKKRLLQDLIDGLAADQGIKKKEAEDFIRLYFDAIQSGLLNERIVKVSGLGTFKLIEVEARNSVNVNTGEAVVIPEHLKLSFLPESSFKEAINKPFADFEPVETTTDNTPRNTETPVGQPTVETTTEKTLPSTDTPIVQPTVETVQPTIEEKTPDIQESLNELITNEKPMKPENPRRPVRTILLIVLGIFFLAGLTYWSIVSNQSAQKDISEKLELVEAYNLNDTIGMMEEPILVDNPTENDSIETEAKPAPVTPTDKQTSTTARTEKPATTTAKTEKPASKRTIPESIVMGAGDRLTLIAQKYYGHKVFWVYIYMENKASISNPNNVAVGTTLRLPDAHPTLMNPANKESIKKAEELQDRIINQLQSSRSK